MKIPILLLFFLVVNLSLLSQNVGVNTDGSHPDNSAILDIQSTTKGLLIPRLSTSEMNNISNPATGLWIFNTQTNEFTYNFGTTVTPNWVTISSSGHYIGELYGGGVVFWVDKSGKHGLVCSLIDLSTGTRWSNITTVAVGVSAQNEWNGYDNSNSIVLQSGHISSSAQRCLDYVNDDYNTGVYDDWFLPSRAEINYLWQNLFEINKVLELDGDAATTPPLSNEFYWTSTEANANSAWAYSFFRGFSQISSKNIPTFSVRAIRAF